VGHVSRSSGLLHVEASRARVFQSGLKIVGCATRMVYVTSLRRLRRGQVENVRIDMMGYIRPYYPFFAIFFVLCPRCVLVFCLAYK
jgi:hypothetical protein